MLFVKLPIINIFNVPIRKFRSVESMLDLVIEIWPLEESLYLLIQWKFQKVRDILFSGKYVLTRGVWALHTRWLIQWLFTRGAVVMTDWIGLSDSEMLVEFVYRGRDKVGLHENNVKRESRSAKASLVRLWLRTKASIRSNAAYMVTGAPEYRGDSRSGCERLLPWSMRGTSLCSEVVTCGSQFEEEDISRGSEVTFEASKGFRFSSKISGPGRSKDSLKSMWKGS